MFDPKARFSVADNADARWMIGEELPGARPEEENTVDLDDELALVRAVSTPGPENPGDDVPASELMHDANEDTSQLDRLYDMLSGISEDSVRIYTGILDPVLYEDRSEPTETVETPEGVGEHTPDDEADEPTRRVHLDDPTPAVEAREPEPAVPAVEDEPTQEVLVEAEEEPKRPRSHASVAQRCRHGMRSCSAAPPLTVDVGPDLPGMAGPVAPNLRAGSVSEGVRIERERFR
ncbi:hypothetical protein G7085_00465 [Tessaracoccus sp. HDW20]|uniref:hypothetical protein n=1 Tax=Tessaracoccus coleopterorum TaxID=2714950 RepID=UPI0018D4CB47|nr:hypothetical protein [Tessaracoccus coleopterorum]NHB83680.1 hypothetical protein [Tessaracoccus coleopterorum]